MSLIDMWPLADEVRRALGVFSQAGFQTVLDDSGLTFPGLLVIFPTFDVDPDPLTAHSIVQRNPYFTHAAALVRLRHGLEQGLVTQDGNNYYVTPEGRQITRRIVDADRVALAKLRPLPVADLEQLAALLQHVTDASLTVAEPADKIGLQQARRYHPGLDSPAIVRVDHLISELAAFRDDVHPATWQSLGVSGPTWEALSFIWREQANTPEAVSERVRGRLNPAGTYEAAFDELVGRGWIEQADSGYCITSQGRAVREEAEATTDRVFYAPWSSLSADETDDLRKLLTQLRESLAHTSV